MLEVACAFALRLLGILWLLLTPVGQQARPVAPMPSPEPVGSQLPGPQLQLRPGRRLSPSSCRWASGRLGRAGVGKQVS